MYFLNINNNKKIINILPEHLSIIITFGNLIAVPLAGCHADVAHINLQNESGVTLDRCQLRVHALELMLLLMHDSSHFAHVPSHLNVPQHEIGLPNEFSA